VMTTSKSPDQDFPAVDRVAAELRGDLVRAARAHAAARPRLLSRRGIIGSIVAVGLVGAPAGLAASGVFSADPVPITFECADAKAELESLDTVAGAPTVGPGAPGAVVEEPSGTPANPCVEKVDLPPLPGD
jgi:hypothetical protein